MSRGGAHRRPGLAALAASLALYALLAEAQEVQQQERVTGGVETRYFRIVGEYASLGVPVEDLGALFDEAFEYVRDRVGLPPDGAPPSETAKISVSIRPPSSAGSALNCPQRGAAFGDEIAIYADGTASPTQLVGLLAHEVGHVLPTTLCL